MKDYESWLDELKTLVKSARISVARSVSRSQNALYWEVGERILATQAELGWSEAVVDRISNDLKMAFPGVTGFSSRNLRDMKRLVDTYSNEAMCRQVVATLQAGEPSSAKWRQVVANLTTLPRRRFERWFRRYPEVNIWSFSTRLPRSWVSRHRERCSGARAGGTPTQQAT